MLDRLSPPIGAKESRKRVGRGPGSGLGKTAGKGQKGQKSRSGVSLKGFEGGQMPLNRRLPKRGFKNIFRVEAEIVNLEALNVFDADSTVDVEALVLHGLVKSGRTGVKILGDGDIDRALNVKVNAFSESARKKIEAAGGTTEVI